VLDKRTEEALDFNKVRVHPTKEITRMKNQRKVTKKWRTFLGPLQEGGADFDLIFAPNSHPKGGPLFDSFNMCDIDYDAAIGYPPRSDLSRSLREINTAHLIIFKRYEAMRMRFEQAAYTQHVAQTLDERHAKEEEFAQVWQHSNKKKMSKKWREFLNLLLDDVVDFDNVGATSPPDE
jgi:hypothetical protein